MRTGLMSGSAALLFAVIGCGSIILSSGVRAESGVTKDSIKIGTFGPLTGAVTIYGYPIINGAVAVYKQVNDEGGIYGRKLEIVYEDDGCDAEKTRAAVKKLIFSDEVFMVHGGNCSGPVFAAKDEFNENKVPFMAMASVLDKISDPLTPYVFTTTQPASRDGVAMLRFANSIPNVKRVAIVKHTDDWADAHVQSIIKGLKDAGLTLVSDVALERNATDATTQVLKIKDQAPDAVFFVTYPNESAVFLRDAKKYGLKGPFIGASSNMDLLAVAQRAGGLDTISSAYVTSYLIGPPDSPDLAKEAAIYRRYFPNDKLQTLTFYGTSGAYAVIEALRRAGPDLTREKFVAALEGLKDVYAGPAYCKITFSKTNHQGCLDGTVWAVREGKVVAIGPTWK
jgi:branched-chain amino acid transport system substrate-binding protein